MLSSENIYLLGAGFTKAACPKAPLNNDLLGAIITNGGEKLLEYQERYKSDDIERLLTQIDLDSLADEQIKKMRLLETIERSRVKVFTDGCSLQYPKKSWDFTCAMSDSVKYANYCFSQTGLNVIFSGTRDCVETAVTGELKRDPIWKYFSNCKCC